LRRGAVVGTDLPSLSVTTCPAFRIFILSVRPTHLTLWVDTAPLARERTLPQSLQTLTFHLGKSDSRNG
jgi:hypothetical protein